MKIKNDNGLLVNEDTGSLVGYLFNFREHGVFSPDGKIDVSVEDADKHNQLLSQAEIAGLDQNCQVGQGGTFYNIHGYVGTFTGTTVATAQIRGNSITFYRNGKTFRGRLQKDADCFNFKRIA